MHYFLRKSENVYTYSDYNISLKKREHEKMQTPRTHYFDVFCFCRLMIKHLYKFHVIFR